MQNAIDDLRSTMMNRAGAQQPQQPAQQAPAAPAQGFSGMWGMPGSRYMGAGGAIKDPASAGSEMPAQQPIQKPSVYTGLKDALSGFGGGMVKPMTGMQPPMWTGAPVPMGPGELPVGLPNDSAKVPPREQRFETAQKMIDGYQNGWSPNPMLIRILEGSR